MRMLIFYEVPLRVKLRTIVAPILGTTREAVMAPAVADSSKLGYTKLYRLLLDHVSSISCCCLCCILLGHRQAIVRTAI